jgi:hypothetical protein
MIDLLTNVRDAAEAKVSVEEVAAVKASVLQLEAAIAAQKLSAEGAVLSVRDLLALLERAKIRPDTIDVGGGGGL